MTPTEVIVALVAGVPTAGAALAAGVRVAFKVLVVDRVKAAEDDAARERADRLASEAALEAELAGARAERDAFKSDWKSSVAATRDLRRRYERALGLPVSDAAPPPRDPQSTLVGYELRRDDVAFLAALAAQEREREIPTARATPRPGPYGATDLPNERPTPTAPRPDYARRVIEDNRQAKDPADGRAVPRPKRR